jgi:hypothetical protein
VSNDGSCHEEESRRRPRKCLTGKVTGVHFEAVLEIDSHTAEVLAHCMSFDLAAYFVEKCSKQYDTKTVSKAFRQLQEACQNIVRTKNEAVKAMNEALRGK